MRYKRHLFSSENIKYSTKCMQNIRAKKRSHVVEVKSSIPSAASVYENQRVESEVLSYKDSQQTQTTTALQHYHDEHEQGDMDDCTSTDSTIDTSELEAQPNQSIQEGINFTTTGPAPGDSCDIHVPLPPMCSHTECTPDDILIMTLSVVCRHKLSWAAMVDILKMVNAIYGEKKINVSKISFLKRLFDNRNGKELTYHYFCEVCCIYIEKKSGIKQQPVICTVCKKNVSDPAGAKYFVSLSLESQLRQLLEDTGNAEKILNHRFTRTKQKDENFEDLYDGYGYRKLSSHGNILSHPQNFSYSFFIDGVAVGNRKKSLWPIYVSINELPPKERRKHILLVGLYYGKHDPDQQFFLKPFVEEANKLSCEGFSWDYKGTPMLSKVIPLIAVADSVARCQIMNFQTFSALYGCTFCYQKPTRTVKRLKYTVPTDEVEERTRESYTVDLQKAYEKRFEAQEKNRHHRGVKGPSTLAELEWFDLFSGCVVDYMHNILLGVCRTYFELVFDSLRRKFWGMLAADEDEKYNIQDVKSEIDARLTTITPPTSINRLPRSITDYGSWKANEWRSWLLFYSIPCLQGLLKRKHLEHFAMLSEASTLLLQNSISRDDVNEAHRLLMTFTYHYQIIFGPEYMFYNIHLLSHICKGVLQWGPIASHNAFMYESYNRTLLQMCKNPFRVVNEVSKKYSVLKSIPKLLDRFASNEQCVFFCEEILDQGLLVFKSSKTCVLLGASSHCVLPAEQRDFLQYNGIDVVHCLFYNRLLFRGLRLTTSQYATNKKNDDSLVYSSCGLYQILAICCFREKSVRLLVKNIEISQQRVLISEHVNVQHMYEVAKFGRMEILHLESIIGHCIFVNIGSKMFLCKMSYGCYGD